MVFVASLGERVFFDVETVFRFAFDVFLELTALLADNGKYLASLQFLSTANFGLILAQSVSIKLE